MQGHTAEKDLRMMCDDVLPLLLITVVTTMTISFQIVIVNITTISIKIIRI